MHILYSIIMSMSGHFVYDMSNCHEKNEEDICHWKCLMSMSHGHVLMSCHEKLGNGQCANAVCKSINLRIITEAKYL